MKSLGRSLEREKQIDRRQYHKLFVNKAKASKMKNRNKPSSNLASIILNRELSGKINSRPSIELLLESSYFSNSDRKHLAQDFPLNDTGPSILSILQYAA